MRLLALDFDGVISDSAPEAFVVSLRTYRAQRPETPLVERAAGFAGPQTPGREAILAHPLYAAWLRDMPLGNRAEDYGVVLRGLEAGVSFPDQAAYDAFRERVDPDWLRAYHERFYRERAALADADPAGWRGLMGPYPPLLDALRRHAGEVGYAIATSKDRRSVRALLELYGVDALFPKGHVLDKETGRSKVAHLTLLHERCRVDFAEITFVDDKANHLDSAAPLGVRCVLAAWGYNGPREEAVARERGYLVCGLDDVEAVLFG